MRRLLFALAACAAIAIAALVPQPAAAHAELVSSSPADGARLTGTTVTLRFSEAVAVDQCRVTVNGTAVPVRATSGTVLVADLGAVSGRALTLDWRAVSSDDGHLTSGVLRFSAKPKPVAAQADPLRWAS